MVTLALYNLKGGVGKTASAVNFAYLAAADGLKTLLWDLDPQGSASFYLQVKADIKHETKKLLTNDVNITEVIRDSAFQDLWVIPSDISARNADLILDNQKQSKKKIRNLLADLNGFDVVFLDCPPGISLLHDNIFNGVQYILMPNIPTTLSIRSFETVEEYFKENEFDTGKLKSFFSMVDHRKNLHHEIVQQYFKETSFFKNYIPYLSDIEKMGINLQPLFEYANSSYAAQCYRELWSEIKKQLKIQKSAY